MGGAFVVLTEALMLGAAPLIGVIDRSFDLCNNRDYSYSQSVEARIIASMGGRVYGPYTGRYFASRRETDIDTWSRHPRPTTAGCAARAQPWKRRFASDPLN